MEAAGSAHDLAAAVEAARREPGLAAAVHEAVTGGGDPVGVLRRAIASVVPRYADGCEVAVWRDGALVRVVAGVDEELARRREATPLPAAGDHPFLDVLRGGPPRLFDLDEDPGALGSPDEPASARTLGIASAVLAPIVAAGEVIGCLALGRSARREKFGPADLDVAVDLGRRLGLAWHNAALLAERASIFASLHDGVVVSDANGVVVDVNDRWVAMSGFPREACIGAAMPHPWWPTAEEHPEALAELGVATASALDSGAVEQRVVLRRADGSWFPALLSMAAVVDSTTGAQRGFVTTIKDITGWEGAQADLLALQRTTAAIAAARSRSEVTKAVLAEAMARLGADAGTVSLLDDAGQRLQLVGSQGLTATQEAEWADVAIEQASPAAHAVRDGELVCVPNPEELAERFPDAAATLLSAGVAAVAAAPIVWDGRPRGALTLAWWAPRTLATSEAALLEAIAAQSGQALDRALGYDVEHHTSQVLQQRLLSDVPLVHERATLVCRYRSASAELTVGGDWYDVVPLGPDCLALVVGDVVGSGIDAAAVMGQLRSALRGILAVRDDPVAALRSLDRVAEGIEGAAGATVCCAVVDLAAERAWVSTAGHPPPVVVRAGGGAELLEHLADPPLGFARRPRRSVEAPLPSGDALLLYTDGLIERPGTLLTDQLDRLVQAAGEADAEVLDDLVDAVLAACAHSGPARDDVAVLAVRDEPPGPDRFRRTAAALPREVGEVRRALVAWLAERGVHPEVVEHVALAASELATNAVEHAYRRTGLVRGTFSVTARAGDRVVVEVRDAGTWKARPSGTVRGRGLAIARAVVESVSLRTGPSGTTAVLRTPAAPAAAGG